MANESVAGETYSIWMNTYSKNRKPSTMLLICVSTRTTNGPECLTTLSTQSIT